MFKLVPNSRAAEDLKDVIHNKLPDVLGYNFKNDAVATYLVALLCKGKDKAGLIKGLKGVVDSKKVATKAVDWLLDYLSKNEDRFASQEAGLKYEQPTPVNGAAVDHLSKQLPSDKADASAKAAPAPKKTREPERADTVDLESTPTPEPEPVVSGKVPKPETERQPSPERKELQPKKLRRNIQPIVWSAAPLPAKVEAPVASDSSAPSGPDAKEEVKISSLSFSSTGLSSRPIAISTGLRDRAAPGDQEAATSASVDEASDSVGAAATSFGSGSAGDTGGRRQRRTAAGQKTTDAVDWATWQKRRTDAAAAEEKEKAAAAAATNGEEAEVKASDAAPLPQTKTTVVGGGESAAGVAGRKTHVSGTPAAGGLLSRALQQATTSSVKRSAAAEAAPASSPSRASTESWSAAKSSVFQRLGVPLAGGKRPTRTEAPQPAVAQDADYYSEEEEEEESRRKVPRVSPPAEEGHGEPEDADMASDQAQAQQLPMVSAPDAAGDTTPPSSDSGGGGGAASELCQVIVSNIPVNLGPAGIEHDILTAHFSVIGPIKSVQILPCTGPTMAGQMAQAQARTSAIVEFFDEEAATQALELNNSRLLDFFTVYVSLKVPHHRRAGLRAANARAAGGQSQAALLLQQPSSAAPSVPGFHKAWLDFPGRRGPGPYGAYPPGGYYGRGYGRGYGGYAPPPFKKGPPAGQAKSFVWRRADPATEGAAEAPAVEAAETKTAVAEARAETETSAQPEEAAGLAPTAEAESL